MLADAYIAKLDLNEDGTQIRTGAKISNRRYITSLSLTPPFDTPKLYANPLLLALMKEFLGRHFVLHTMGSVTALPGAEDQHLHADYYQLFEESPHLGRALPSYGITVGVPLIDVDVLSGPTKAWSGSHRVLPIEPTMEAYYKSYVYGPMGSCYFWDYRTFHAGGSNHSEKIRPLLFLAYTRRWFCDLFNPDGFNVEKEEYQNIPEEHRWLFARFAPPQEKANLAKGYPFPQSPSCDYAKK